MKTLVTYYSKTGNTKKVAEKLSGKLKADIDEVIDKKNRKGAIRWLIAGGDAMKKKKTDIEYKKKPENYELVIIGTPIWAFTVAPAIREYINQNKNKLKKVAFFCTHGGNFGDAFNEMEKLSKKPIATIALFDREVKKDNFNEELNAFCEKLK